MECVVLCVLLGGESPLAQGNVLFQRDRRGPRHGSEDEGQGNGRQHSRESEGAHFFFCVSIEEWRVRD